jgi:threonine aldolase
MNNNLIDLRSDTVTKPCERMRLAMYNAEVGDNYYKEDYITTKLEEYCAELFGTKSALFMVTGTMANQIAIRCHTKAGDEIITDNCYHIIYYESGPTSDLGKVSTNALHTEDGILTEQHLKLAFLNRHRSQLAAYPRLIWLENTINYYSGKIYPLDKLRVVYNFAQKNKLVIHIDGARLLNACVANKTPKNAYSSVSNSIMVSFSKGLGAPAGAILLGNEEFIEQARRYQKWYGGGMHQSGILAAAALYAISNNVDRLSLDNNNAKVLSEILSRNENLNLIAKSVETNIVMFSVKKLNISAKNFVELIKQQGVLLYPWNGHIVRAVTHKDISKPLIIKAANIILEIVNKLQKL